jgi:hypothetical protein
MEWYCGMGDLPGSPGVAPSTLFLHASEMRERRGLAPFLHASEMRERRGLAPSLARIRDEGEAGLGPLLGTRPR